MADQKNYPIIVPGHQKNQINNLDLLVSLNPNSKRVQEEMNKASKAGAARLSLIQIHERQVLDLLIEVVQSQAFFLLVAHILKILKEGHHKNQSLSLK